MFGRILRAGGKSWKTTALGVIGGLTVLLNAATALLDDDPTTVFDAGMVSEATVGIVLILWGLFTRDADKTSRESGVE